MARVCRRLWTRRYVDSLPDRLHGNVETKRGFARGGGSQHRRVCLMVGWLVLSLRTLRRRYPGSHGVQPDHFTMARILQGFGKIQLSPRASGSPNDHGDPIGDLAPAAATWIATYAVRVQSERNGSSGYCHWLRYPAPVHSYGVWGHSLGAHRAYSTKYSYPRGLCHPGRDVTSALYSLSGPTSRGCDPLSSLTFRQSINNMSTRASKLTRDGSAPPSFVVCVPMPLVERGRASQLANIVAVSHLRPQFQSRRTSRQASCDTYAFGLYG